MAQGVHRRVFMHTRYRPGGAEGLLDGADGHRAGAGRPVEAAAPDGGKEPLRVAVGLPATLQQGQDGRGQRDVAVLDAFGGVDVDHAAHAVNIGQLQAASFAQAQAAGVDEGQAGAVAQLGDLVQDGADFLAGQDHGQLVPALRARHAGEGEVAPQGGLVEELDAAEGDGDGGPGELAHTREVDEVRADLLVGELVWRSVVEAGQSGDGADIGELGLLGEPAQRHVLPHTLLERRDGVPGPAERVLVQEADPGGGMGPGGPGYVLGLEVGEVGARLRSGDERRLALLVIRHQAQHAPDIGALGVLGHALLLHLRPHAYLKLRGLS